jgi:hypothetical protein
MGAMGVSPMGFPFITFGKKMHPEKRKKINNAVDRNQSIL